MSKQTLEYPLSPKYIPNWTIGEALRELIANAFDIDDSPSIIWRDGFAEIIDHGVGIHKSFWVIGEGNHGEIGQFGEGLKMAMLVLAREERTVQIVTVGYSVEPSLVLSEVYASTVLALTFDSFLVREHGTLIRVACSKAEFTEAHNRFLKLKPRRMASKRLQILKDPGVLFINGVFASKVDSLWGYNITDKSITNRDRTVLDQGGVKSHISRTLLSIKREELVMELLNNAVLNPESKGHFVEYNVMGTPLNKTVWKRAFRKIFGDKACLSDGALSQDNYLRNKGYRVLDYSVLGYSLSYTFERAGVHKTSDLVKEFHDTLVFDLIDDQLTSTEKERLRYADEIARRIAAGTDVSDVHVVESFPESLGSCTLGLYYKKIVYVLRETLETPESITGILIHEYLHGLGYEDASCNFEAEMTTIMGQLAVRAY